jgi:DNA-binding transcriptional regulator LsrR (DeoR family)
MSGERRARADQYARRINAASELLASGWDVAEAARELARRHRISERQARRYVEQARDEGPRKVPSAKIVFTVKLPTDLARQVRKQAVRSEQTISSVVAAALREFLDRVGKRSRNAR